MNCMYMTREILDIIVKEETANTQIKSIRNVSVLAKPAIAYNLEQVANG